MDKKPSRQVKCPQCGKLASFSSTENPFRPFCSERCRLIDLGAWASGDYKVPTQDHVDIDTDKVNPEKNDSDDKKSFDVD